MASMAHPLHLSQARCLQCVPDRSNVHLMQIPDTPRAELVNLKLQAATGEALGPAVQRLRDEGQIWTQIAAYLTTQTGVEIGREGLRQWFKDEVAV